MRPPTERDQCQAKLDILIEGFMPLIGPPIARRRHGCATLPIRKISNAAA
jgi:hypothetical protein